MIGDARRPPNFGAYHSKQLPPLPADYFGTAIDEVSSARDSIIENESQINVYNEQTKK